MLTEEEKRTLVAEGYPVPNKLPLTKTEEKALKRVRRKIKNKVNSQIPTQSFAGDICLKEHSSSDVWCSWTVLRLIYCIFCKTLRNLLLLTWLYGLSHLPSDWAPTLPGFALWPFHICLEETITVSDKTDSSVHGYGAISFHRFFIMTAVFPSILSQLKAFHLAITTAGFWNRNA